MVMGDLERRIDACERRQNQTVRVGLVRKTQPQEGTVIVELADSDKVLTKALPVVFPKTGNDRSYDMPDIDEQVVCIFLANGMEQGFVLGSVYSKLDVPPRRCHQDVQIREYKDGTRWSYDRKQHHEETRNQGSWSYIAKGRIKIRGQRIDLN